jgi:hypothetical protein
METQTPAAYSIDEFCRTHRIARSFLYKLWGEGRGPRVMRVGSRRLISLEDAADWRREMEAVV